MTLRKLSRAAWRLVARTVNVRRVKGTSFRAKPSDGGKIRVGLESRASGGRDELELCSNWKYRKRDFYRAAIERIQSRGITLIGYFVLVLDGDPEVVFDLNPRLVEEALAHRHRRCMKVYGRGFREGRSQRCQA